MKVAVAIPTYNAENGCWGEVLQAVEQQDFACDIKLIVDSGSSDQTCAVAERYGWKCIRIRKEKFDHGGTRRKIVKYLYRKQFDTVVLMTQDVVLSRPDSLRNLVKFLHQNSLAGCYGRQLSGNCGSLHKWQRERCYPENSSVKTKADISSLGLMTAFFSDAFGAWNIPLIMKYGAFPDAEFGEDTLLAGKLILEGHSLGYCAEAECHHEHKDDWRTLWIRGRQVGEMHRKEAWLIKTFGMPVTKQKDGKNPPLPLRALFSFCIKSAGYVFGKFISSKSRKV